MKLAITQDHFCNLRQGVFLQSWVLLITLLFCAPVLAEVPEPEGYKLEDYDSEVPSGLAGAKRVTAVEVLALSRLEDSVIIDVIPEHRRPDWLPENQLWFPVDHKGIPGALWLPDTGFGALSPVTEKYFTDHLTAATGGNLDAHLTFYCRIDCWMSWNAAKRALSYGYNNVYWFADGVDDWFFEGFEFAILKPAPGERQEK